MILLNVKINTIVLFNTLQEGKQTEGTHKTNRKILKNALVILKLQLIGRSVTLQSSSAVPETV